MTEATESLESPDKRMRPGLKIQIDDDNGEREAGDWHSNGSGDEGNELSNLERSESFNNAPSHGGTDVINLDE